jgi:glucosamine-6-phosphate deaminase
MEISFKVKLSPNTEAMALKSGIEAGNILRDYTSKGKNVVAVFAAAPSQDKFLDKLSKEKEIEWEKVQGYHLDEYYDLPRKHPNTFESYLEEHLLSKIPIKRENMHFMKEISGPPEKVAEEYGAKLKTAAAKVKNEGGLYICFIGIGVNGHIAFNEPNSDIFSNKWVIPVEIDDTSVKQQFDDYKNHPDPEARYKTIDAVPRRALTMTCSAILASDKIIAVVPGKQKAKAVKGLIEGEISEKLPSSLLKLHRDCTIYLDEDSAGDVISAPEPQG